MERKCYEGRGGKPAMQGAQVLQYSWGLTLLFVLASVCWVLLPCTGYVFPALVFLLEVVVAGIWWDRGPVLTVAVVSALTWNFIFIPPRFTLHIQEPQDVVMFILFFVVALSMGHLISRLREREAALERHLGEREHLMEERRRAEVSAEAERLHRTLLDGISHEMKTPLSVIRTALDGLGQENGYAAEIGIATRRLQRMVDNFLEITKVESGSVRPHPDWCELGDVLHAARVPLQGELGSREVQVRGVEELPLLYLDGRLLAQALGNVWHNALLYSPADTPIHLEASLQEGCLRITVRDHGPGLPEGVEKQLFQKFYRVPDSPAGGSGLGLAISRGLLRAMKGDLEARNHPRGGAEFVLSLPVKNRDTEVGA